MQTLELEHLTVQDLTTPRDKLSVALVRMTSPMARELIDAEGHHLKANRPVSAATVESYRRDMLGHRWQMTGETLAFNEKGELINGEHRVRALARITDNEFGVPLLVVFGLSDEARKAMDDPRKRTAADELNMSGGADGMGTKLVQVLRALVLITQGQGAGGRLSKPALIELAARHPDLVADVKRIMGVAKDDQIPVRPSVIAAMYYAAKLSGEVDRAEAALIVMQTGDRDYEGDPMHAWREYVIKSKTKVSEAELIRGTLKAWDMFRRGDKVVGRFSIPKDQPAMLGLTPDAVFGDMVETSFITPKPQPKPATAPAPKATKGTAAKAAKGQKPFHNEEQGATVPVPAGTAEPSPSASEASPPADASPAPHAADAEPAAGGAEGPDDLTTSLAEAHAGDRERANEALKFAGKVTVSGRRGNKVAHAAN